MKIINGKIVHNLDGANTQRFDIVNTIATKLEKENKIKFNSHQEFIEEVTDVAETYHGIIGMFIDDEDKYWDMCKRFSAERLIEHYEGIEEE